ncbi:hypothetical protein IWQ61_008825, partial [Dispira simplex]
MTIIPNEMSPFSPSAQDLLDEVGKVDLDLKSATTQWGPLHRQTQALRTQLRALYHGIIFTDLTFAHHHDVETSLWKTGFYKVFDAYRRQLRQFPKPTNAAEIATLQKLQASFRAALQEATGFYHTLIQQLHAYYQLPALSPLLVNPSRTLFDLTLGDPSFWPERISDPTRCDLARLTYYRCLIILGDLARYREQHSDRQPKTWLIATLHYHEALQVMPHHGNPHNQLAVLASYTNHDVMSLYHYYRSLVIPQPFATAQENIKLSLKVFQRKWLRDFSREGFQPRSDLWLPVTSLKSLGNDTLSDRAHPDIQSQRATPSGRRRIRRSLAVNDIPIHSSDADDYDRRSQLLGYFERKFVYLHATLHLDWDLEQFTPTLTVWARDLRYLIRYGLLSSDQLLQYFTMCVALVQLLDKRDSGDGTENQNDKTSSGTPLVWSRDLSSVPRRLRYARELLMTVVITVLLVTLDKLETLHQLSDTTTRGSLGTTPSVIRPGGPVYEPILSHMFRDRMARIRGLLPLLVVLKVMVCWLDRVVQTIGGITYDELVPSNSVPSGTNGLDRESWDSASDDTPDHHLLDILNPFSVVTSPDDDDILESTAVHPLFRTELWQVLARVVNHLVQWSHRLWRSVRTPTGSLTLLTQLLVDLEEATLWEDNELAGFLLDPRCVYTTPSALPLVIFHDSDVDETQTYRDSNLDPPLSSASALSSATPSQGQFCATVLDYVGFKNLNGTPSPPASSSIMTLFEMVIRTLPSSVDDATREFLGHTRRILTIVDTVVSMSRGNPRWAPLRFTTELGDASEALLHGKVEERVSSSTGLSMPYPPESRPTTEVDALARLLDIEPNSKVGLSVGGSKGEVGPLPGVHSQELDADNSSSGSPVAVTALTTPIPSDHEDRLEPPVEDRGLPHAEQPATSLLQPPNGAGTTPQAQTIMRREISGKRPAPLATNLFHPFDNTELWTPQLPGYNARSFLHSNSPHRPPSGELPAYDIGHLSLLDLPGGAHRPTAHNDYQPNSAEDDLDDEVILFRGVSDFNRGPMTARPPPLTISYGNPPTHTTSHHLPVGPQGFHQPMESSSALSTGLFNPTTHTTSLSPLESPRDLSVLSSRPSTNLEVSMGLTPALTRSPSRQQGMLPPWLDEHSRITRVSGSFLSMVSASQSPEALGDGLHLQDSLVTGGPNPSDTNDTVASVVATALSESASSLSTSIPSTVAVPYATAFNPRPGGPTTSLGAISESEGTSPVMSSATTDILKFFAGQVGLAAPSAFPRGPTGGGLPSASGSLNPNPSSLGSLNTAFPTRPVYMGAKHSVGNPPTRYNPPAVGSLSLDQIISGDYPVRGSGLDPNSPNPRRPSIPPGFEAPETAPLPSSPQNPMGVGSPLAWTGNTQFGSLAWSASPLPTAGQMSSSSSSSHLYPYPYPNQYSTSPQP